MNEPGLGVTAPGTSSVSETKFRPFSGRFVACVLLMTSPVCVLSVCRMGATPVTSTDSVTAPTSIFTSTLAVWLTSSLKGPSTVLLKLGASAVTV